MIVNNYKIEYEVRGNGTTRVRILNESTGGVMDIEGRTEMVNPFLKVCFEVFGVLAEPKP